MIFSDNWHEYCELHFKNFQLNLTSNYMIKAGDAHSSSLMPHLCLGSFIHSDIQIGGSLALLRVLVTNIFLTV